MKKIKLLAAIAILAFAGILAAVHAADEKAKDVVVTITGEVIDLSCYSAGGAKGPGHAGCATKCLKGGSPMGILTEGDKAYLVTNHGDDASLKQLKDLAAKTVTVTGKESKRGGILAINITKIDKQG